MIDLAPEIGATGTVLTPRQRPGLRVVSRVVSHRNGQLTYHSHHITGMNFQAYSIGSQLVTLFWCVVLNVSFFPEQKIRSGIAGKLDRKKCTN
jgi:hypothetical protein